MGSWAGPDHQNVDDASGGPEHHHTARKNHPQPDESEAPPPDQTQIDDQVSLEFNLNQSVRAVPWNSLHVQHKKT